MFSGSAFAAAPFAATGSDTFNAAIAEAASVIETVLARVAFSSSIAETATGSDSVSVVASSFGAVVSETATAADSATVIASSFSAIVAEMATGTDSPSVAPSTFNAQVAETVAALDQIYAYGLFICVITESGTIIDVATARLLWEIINDSAPTTWSDIPTLD